jgi:HlyD family secretion protein
VNRNNSKTGVIAGTVILLGLLLAYTFWPRPFMVDMAKVVVAPMQVTINEEAKTRVRNAYVVSAPIAGKIERVEVEAGDKVIAGETIIARMQAVNPSALDVRTREQALASVKAAEAALRVARADLNKAIADRELAESELTRTKQLFNAGNLSQAALDKNQQLERSAKAQFDTAKAAISMREAELANARARLISFSETPALTQQAATNNTLLEAGHFIPLHAPISGSILRVMQKSETTLPAGAPILEIGNIDNDLEVVVELLSTDAVQVSAGDKVIIDKWGKPEPLRGIVERVEPWGFTKFSALGVEEQRVNAIIKFTDPEEQRPGLGHGYRVEARIVIWEQPEVLSIPSSALFRDQGQWAVFAVEKGKARFQAVEIGHNNGQYAQLKSGLEQGQEIILYPSPGLTDGTAVKQRVLEAE